MQSIAFWLAISKIRTVIWELCTRKESRLFRKIFRLIVVAVSARSFSTQFRILLKISLKCTFKNHFLHFKNIFGNEILFERRNWQKVYIILKIKQFPNKTIDEINDKRVKIGRSTINILKRRKFTRKQYRRDQYHVKMRRNQESLFHMTLWF